jgi:hypothetical protein
MRMFAQPPFYPIFLIVFGCPLRRLHDHVVIVNFYLDIATRRFCGLQSAHQIALPK